MRKIEHLGIAVKSLIDSDDLFSKLLNIEPYKKEVVESEAVSTSFFLLGQTKVELLESKNETSAIAKYIDKRGEGIHHIALDVIDMDFEIDRLKKLGFLFINENAKAGADGKKIVFLHPKSTNGVLVELCEDINNPTV
ncbi:MAG: methylmalonyl-CoA epimerase [Flavobacteriales bacterium]|nr:methylmalonyl-CoA epimerase [Flavobacteriales bacterium]